MAKREKQLPKEFKKYFWDVEFERLSFSKNLNLILCRLLGFGNMNAVRWLFANVSDGTIKKYLLSLGQRQLDARSFNFWSLIFHAG